VHLSSQKLACHVPPPSWQKIRCRTQPFVTVEVTDTIKKTQKGGRVRGEREERGGEKERGERRREEGEEGL
jgi:hypothetical protein